MNRTNDTATNSNAEYESENESEVSGFLNKCLDNKIKVCNPNKNCHTVKRDLRWQLDLLTEKDARIQKAIKSCLRICGKKDEQIEVLEQQIKEKNKCIETIPSRKVEVLFGEYVHHFADNQLSMLRSIDKSSKGDSNFVLNSLRFSYLDDLAKLQHKSVTGKSKSGQKEPITPQKLNRLKSMYKERLNGLDSSDRKKREKQFNRHVQHAITNININMKNNSKRKISVLPK